MLQAWAGCISCVAIAVACLAVALRLAKRPRAAPPPTPRPRPVPWDVILNADPDRRAARRERRRRLVLLLLSMIWAGLVVVNTFRGPMAFPGLWLSLPQWAWVVIALAPCSVAEWYCKDFRCPRCGQVYGMGACAQCGLDLRPGVRAEDP